MAVVTMEDIEKKARELGELLNNLPKDDDDDSWPYYRAIVLAMGKSVPTDEKAIEILKDCIGVLRFAICKYCEHPEDCQGCSNNKTRDEEFGKDLN